jgi:hypothetical protein
MSTTPAHPNNRSDNPGRSGDNMTVDRIIGTSRALRRAGRRTRSRGAYAAAQLV